MNSTGDQFSLCFDGFENQTPDGLQRFKALCIADLEFSVDATIELLSQPGETRILKTAESLGQLAPLYETLRTLGAKVAIIDSLGNQLPPTQRESTGAQGEITEEFTFELDDLLCHRNTHSSEQQSPPKEYTLDLDAPMSLSDLGFDSDIELPPSETALFAPVDAPSREESLSTLSLVYDEEDHPLDERETQSETESGSLDELVSSVALASASAPIAELALEASTGDASLELGPIPAMTAPTDGPTTPETNLLESDFSLALDEVPQGQSPSVSAASAPEMPQPILALEVAESDSPEDTREAPQVINSASPPALSQNPSSPPPPPAHVPPPQAVSPHSIRHEEAGLGGTPNSTSRKRRARQQRGSRDSDRGLSKGQLAVISGFGVALLFAVNWLMQEPPSATARANLISPVTTKKTSAAMVDSSSAIDVRMLGGAQTAAYSAEASMRLVGERITAKLSLTTPQPAELTGEELGRGELPRPWLRKAETDEFVMKPAPGGVWHATVPTYVYIERGSEKVRVPATGEVDLSLSDTKDTGRVAFKVTYNPPGDATSNVATQAFVEPLSGRAYRVAFDATVTLTAHHPK